jgi:subtilisin-like proprotein convertase family protein
VSHYYKVKDIIEIEVEVENQSLNDMDLELIPPSEVLQHLSSEQEVRDKSMKKAKIIAN